VPTTFHTKMDIFSLFSDGAARLCYDGKGTGWWRLYLVECGNRSGGVTAIG